MWPPCLCHCVLLQNQSSSSLLMRYCCTCVHPQQLRPGNADSQEPALCSTSAWPAGVQRNDQRMHHAIRMAPGQLAGRCWTILLHRTKRCSCMQIARCSMGNPRCHKARMHDEAESNSAVVPTNSLLAPRCPGMTSHKASAYCCSAIANTFTELGNRSTHSKYQHIRHRVLPPGLTDVCVAR